MASKTEAPVWARNLRQWLKTSETDLYNAVGEAEKGKDGDLAEKYGKLAATLGRAVEDVEKRFELKPTKGRRELKAS